MSDEADRLAMEAEQRQVQMLCDMLTCAVSSPVECVDIGGRHFHRAELIDAALNLWSLGEPHELMDRADDKPAERIN